MSSPLIASADRASWRIDTSLTTAFDFDYQGGREQLLRLYDRGTRKQWIGADRLDWSLEVDPTDPLGMPDQSIPIADTPLWARMGERDRNEVRRHAAAWRFSQFMHGEQGALVCTAKIVQSVPDLDAKFYAATQVIDEARHVEVYSRYLHEKLQLVYPMNPNLGSLLHDVISDSRWDMTYLGMQVLIEGLALAAFGLIRNQATEPLGRAINAYVMQDEARHVMFGRLALRDYYPQLTEAERDEREEFCVDACYRMRDRFLAEELWQNLDLPIDDVMEHLRHSESQRMFRSYLFMRIVPILRDIGLWGPRIRGAFEDMGVLAFADADIDAAMADDERAADEFDAASPTSRTSPTSREPFCPSESFVVMRSLRTERLRAGPVPHAGTRAARCVGRGGSPPSVSSPRRAALRARWRCL